MIKSIPLIISLAVVIAPSITVRLLAFPFFASTSRSMPRLQIFCMVVLPSTWPLAMPLWDSWQLASFACMARQIRSTSSLHGTSFGLCIWRSCPSTYLMRYILAECLNVGQIQSFKLSPRSSAPRSFIKITVRYAKWCGQTQAKLLSRWRGWTSFRLMWNKPFVQVDAAGWLDMYLGHFKAWRRKKISRLWFQGI